MWWIIAIVYLVIGTLLLGLLIAVNDNEKEIGGGFMFYITFLWPLAVFLSIGILVGNKVKKEE